MKRNKGAGDKRKRMITMDIKHEIIEKHESGARVSDLARDYDRTTSTICTILKQKEAIKKLKPSRGVTIMHPSRTDVHIEMEKLLLTWIKEKHLAGDTITEGVICDKAFEIYTDLKETSGEVQPSTSTGKTIPFKASHGWYEKFKKRTGIHLMLRHGEDTSSDVAAAKEFAEHFGRLIAREGYIAEQVFNYDQTRLFWKNLPRKAFISGEENQVPELKDSLTLAFCANARGNLKIKPLLVYHSDNPSAFKTNKVNKTKLLVMWRTNAKAWVTPKIFIEWVNEVFGPSVKKYLIEKKLPLKCLLVLDNAVSHLSELGKEILDEFNFIHFIYLPSVASPLHRLYQYVISNFKKLYIKHFLKKCFDVTDATNLTFEEFLENHFDIVNGLKIIDEAWREVSKIILNLAWRKIWPEIVAEKDIEEFASQQEAALNNEIISLGKSVNLEIDKENISDLIAEHPLEMTAEDLLHVELSEGIREEKNEPEQNISSKEIKKMLKKWEEVCDFIDSHHPDKFSCSRARVFFNETCVQHFINILKIRKSQSS